MFDLPFGLVGPAAKAFGEYRNHNEVRNLFRLLKKEILGDYRIPGEKREWVWKKVDGLRADPEFAGILIACIEGDLTGLARAQRNLEETFSFRDDDVEPSALAKRVVAAIEENVGAAKRNDRSASQIEHRITRAQIADSLHGESEHVVAATHEEGRRTREQAEELNREQEEHRAESLRTESERHAELLRAIGAAAGPGGKPQEVVYLRLDWVPEGAHEVMEELIDVDAASAERLRRELQEAPDRLEELIQDPDSWIRGGRRELLAAAAALAEQRGNWGLASEAWVVVADVEGDKAAALVAAATAEKVAGNEVDYERLIDRAREIEATSPHVRFHDALDVADPQARLAALAGIEFSTPRHSALVEAARALAYLEADEIDAADGRIAAGRAHQPKLKILRVAAANAVVHRNRLAVIGGRLTDADTLMGASEECLAVREEYLAQGRFEEGARALMLASDATFLAEGGYKAAALLRRARPEERSASGGTVLAEAALRAQEYELAEELLPPDDVSDEVRFVRASARAASRRPATRSQGMRVLDEIISAGGPHLEGAALTRLVRSPWYPDVAWSDEAEMALAASEHHDWVLGLKALYLAKHGDPEAAERLLEPHADAAWAIEARFNLALEGRDKNLAAERAREVLALGPDHVVRLQAAVALKDAGDVQRAESELRTLCRDKTASVTARCDAFTQLTSVLEDRHDFEGALAVLDEWVTVNPHDSREHALRVRMASRLKASRG